MVETMMVDNGYGRRELAFTWTPRGRIGVVFLAGFASNMQGTKANWLDRFCADEGFSYLRFDYSGHGRSSGSFEDGTIGLWLDDARAIFDHVIDRPTVLVGSSMGGWLMLHLARSRRDRVCGLVGIASAPDFIARLEEGLDKNAATELRRSGRTLMPSDYGAPLALTQNMIDDAKRWRVLQDRIDIEAPCHLLHGQCDLDVDWRTSLELASRLASPHVTVELIKDGDHRLARPKDLKRLGSTIRRLTIEWEERCLAT